MLARGERSEASGPLGALNQGTAAGIGLASEGYQHNQENKRARKQQEEQPDRNGHNTSQR